MSTQTLCYTVRFNIYFKGKRLGSSALTLFSDRFDSEGQMQTMNEMIELSSVLSEKAIAVILGKG